MGPNEIVQRGTDHCLLGVLCWCEVGDAHHRVDLIRQAVTEGIVSIEKEGRA